MRSLGALAVLWLPPEARPLAVAALNLVDSGTVGRARSSSWWWWWPLVAAPLLLVLTALPALAHASPPDPSWIAGLYDDADYDDVVVLAAAGVAWVDPDLVVDLRPVVVPVAEAATAPGEIVDGRPLSTVRPRAPPPSPSRHGFPTSSAMKGDAR